jgi:hypothetical protein
MRIFIALTGLTLATLLLGCGSHEPASATAAGKPAAAATPGKPPPANAAWSENMVAAFSGPHTGPANVQMKFELRARPQVAQPLDIDVVIVPASATVDRIYGTVEAGEGLQLADGGHIALSERPADGLPIHHAVRVLPAKDGIFMVNAVVTVDSGGQSSTHSFSIPVIVGEGVPAAKPVPAAEAVKPVASR